MAKAKQAQPEAETKQAPEKFNGVAFTFQASNGSGFSNYRICTLFIVEGEIVHIEKTQEYATFEALARGEVLLSAGIWNLSSRYKSGDYQSLGGDQRDELINRLKKTDPELLKKIEPALCLKKAEVA